MFEEGKQSTEWKSEKIYLLSADLAQNQLKLTCDPFFEDPISQLSGQKTRDKKAF